MVVLCEISWFGTVSLSRAPFSVSSPLLLHSSRKQVCSWTYDEGVNILIKYNRGRTKELSLSF